MQVVKTSTTSVQLIGCFQMLIGPQPVHLPLQAQRLVAFLAVSEQPAARQQLAERLWPFTKQQRAHANLRTALWRVRQEAPSAVASDRETVQLHPDVRIDYQQMLQTEGTEGSLTAIPEHDAVARLRNDLLQGWDEEWLIIERERARQLRMRCLENLSRRYVATGHITAAIDAAYASIEIEPLRESAHLVLIEAHHADGNSAEAVRQARRFVKLMADELHISPSASFSTHLGKLGLGPGSWAT